MSLLKRVGWYLGGFSVGLIILSIFLKKKNAEFCYGIDCRILKNIRSKNVVYSKPANDFMLSNGIDTLVINGILLKGDVNMSKSNTKLDSCKIYSVEGNYKEDLLFLTIQNCNKTATVELIEMQ